MPEETTPTGSETTETTEKTETSELMSKETEKTETTETKKEGGEKKSEANNEDEVPVRKTPLDYILERKRQKLEKLKREQISKADEELSKLNSKEEEDDDDLFDELEDENDKRVARVVKKLYGSSLEKISSSELDSEVSQFVKDNEDFGPYKDKIVKWAKHPAYSQLPIAQIAYAVAGLDLLKLGAKKARENDEQIDRDKISGNSTKRVSMGKDPMKMSTKEFEDYLAKVKGQA